MSVTTFGLDLAESVFQVHGIDLGGHTALKRRVTRQGLLALLEDLPPCLVVMEACPGAHYRAREFVELDHDVRLIPPRYVKPYVKRNKTDAADAEAICEGLEPLAQRSIDPGDRWKAQDGRPNMRFVPIKTKESQGLPTLHRVRSLLARRRTAMVNAARGLQRACRV